MRSNKFAVNDTIRKLFATLFVSFIIQGVLPAFGADASTPAFHTVTFVENDSPTDPVYSSQTANAQTALTSFANLNPPFVNNGFTFGNWNSSSDGTGTTYANGSTYSFAAAEVLYAIWVRNYHSVTFVENDNSTDVVDAVQTENAPTALSMFATLSPTFANPGFTFIDWNSNSNGSGVAFADGSIFSFSGPEVLYATWSPIPITTLNFESTGGSGSVASLSSQTGESTTLPSGSGISNPGYTFVGWNTAANRSGIEYAAGGTYIFTVNQTLFAQWSPDTYTVEFSYDAGVVGIATANYVVGTPALILPTPTFSGNTFDGWFDTQTGGSLIGIGGETYVPSGSIQLFAHWTSIELDVLNFNSNGGAGTVASYSGEDGSSTVLPTIGGVSRLGFAFSGWNTKGDGSGTQYVEGQTLTLANTNQTLYAQWIVGASDTVTFDANGGSGIIDPITGSPGSTITLPDQSGLIHAGYALTRWNTNATGSGISYSVGQGFKLAGSIVLYAQWNGHKPSTLICAIGTFKAGSSSLSPALKSQINRLALTIRTKKYSKIDMFGYTGATGLHSLNVELSRARANKAAAYLRIRLKFLKVHGVTILAAGEGSIVGQSSNAYSRVEIFGV